MTLYELTKSIELLSPSETQFVWDYGIAFERACFHDYCHDNLLGITFSRCAIHSDVEWERMEPWRDSIRRERSNDKL